MKELSKNDITFCQVFLDSFSISRACLESDSIELTMVARMEDTTNELSMYLRNAIDSRDTANKFMSNGLIVNELVQILMDGEHQHKLQAGKMLLSLTEGGDKTKGFTDLINAIKGA